MTIKLVIFIAISIIWLIYSFVNNFFLKYKETSECIISLLPKIIIIGIGYILLFWKDWEFFLNLFYLIGLHNIFTVDCGRAHFSELKF